MKVEETSNSTNKRLTARMIHFVNLLVSGNDHITAYQTAYDCSGSTRATIIGNANRLMKDSRITMQLESVLEVRMQYQGKLWDRYQCYLAYTDEPNPKTFEEWLNS